MVGRPERREEPVRSHITLALMASFLIVATDAVGAATVVWHHTGSCNGRPIGSVWYGPERNACGEPRMHRCVRKGVPLPPPRSCNAPASTARAPRLLPVDPNNRFGNAPIHRRLQFVTH